MYVNAIVKPDIEPAGAETNGRRYATLSSARKPPD